MLVMQLTRSLFIFLMQTRDVKYTEEGLSLIWKEYKRDEEEMPEEDIRVNLDSVSRYFHETSLLHFVEFELNAEYHRYFPLGVKNMNNSELSELKKEIQAFLGRRFLGFTDLNRVVFKR